MDENQRAVLFMPKRLLLMWRIMCLLC